MPSVYISSLSLSLFSLYHRICTHGSLQLPYCNRNTTESNELGVSCTLCTNLSIFAIMKTEIEFATFSTSGRNQVYDVSVFEY
jgi:hypothetical protein